MMRVDNGDRYNPIIVAAQSALAFRRDGFNRLLHL